MNKGLAFVLGCVVGGAGGGFLAHTVLKQKYAQKADEEIIACREAFQDELVKLRKEANEKEAEKKKADAEAALQKYRGESNDNTPPFDVEPKKHEADLKPKRTQIDETDYNDPANPNKKKCLQFFPIDNVLLQEDGTIMDQATIETTIGIETLACFNDEDVVSVWIHNESLQTDYEITQVGMSYLEWKRKYNQ